MSVIIPPLPRSIPWSHLIRATLALLACGLLIVAEGGSPPPIVLLPFVLVLWSVGHVVILAVRWLAARRRARGGFK